MLTSEEYLKNPCGTLATAFWKEAYFPKPNNVRIFHKDSVPNADFKNNATAYFRMIHYPKDNYNIVMPEGFAIRKVCLPEEAHLAASLINRCYPGSSFDACSIIRWTDYPVFNNDLWVFIWDENAKIPAALGIADFDKNIEEASLEWIQVLSEYRGLGLGQNIVLELLFRLKDYAGFITVSGEVNNVSNPEKLYRKCGFEGNDIWYVGR